jgi:hypothetical protein
MARGKALTYEEFVALAKENYTKGGDVVVECWEKYQFDDYVNVRAGYKNKGYENVQTVEERRKRATRYDVW